MVQQTMCPPLGKATKPGGPKSLFQRLLRVLILKCRRVLCFHAASSTQSLPSTGTEGMGWNGGGHPWDGNSTWSIIKASSLRPFSPQPSRTVWCRDGYSFELETEWLGTCYTFFLLSPPGVGKGDSRATSVLLRVCKISHSKWKVDSQSCWAHSGFRSPNNKFHETNVLA